MSEYLVRVGPNSKGDNQLWTYLKVTDSSKVSKMIKQSRWKKAHYLATIVEMGTSNPQVENHIKVPLRKKDTLSFKHAYYTAYPDGSIVHRYIRNVSFTLQDISELDDAHRDILLEIEAGGRRQ